MTSVSANSEGREHAGLNAFFENASESSNKLNTTNENDETRRNIHDEVSELSVPGTHFDRQPHTHHNSTKIMKSKSKKKHCCRKNRSRKSSLLMIIFCEVFAGRAMVTDIAGLPGAGANSKPHHYKQKVQKGRSFRKHGFHLITV